MRKVSGRLPPMARTVKGPSALTTAWGGGKSNRSASGLGAVAVSTIGLVEQRHQPGEDGECQAAAGGAREGG